MTRDKRAGRGPGRPYWLAAVAGAFLLGAAVGPVAASAAQSQPAAPAGPAPAPPPGRSRG